MTRFCFSIRRRRAQETAINAVPSRTKDPGSGVAAAGSTPPVMLPVAVWGLPTSTPLTLSTVRVKEPELELPEYVTTCELLGLK